MAWDSVEAGHGDVAIEPAYAIANDLPPTIAHPRNPEKLFYIIEAYHSIHCIVSRCAVPRLCDRDRMNTVTVPSDVCA